MLQMIEGPSQNKNTSSRPDLTPDEKLLERQCSACANSMKVTARENESWVGPGNEQGLRFVCIKCEKNVWVADPSTVSSTLFSGAAVLAGVGYALFNDVAGFISDALFTESTLLSVIIGLGLSIFLLVFLYGGINLLWSSLLMIYNRSIHPQTSGGKASSKLGLILFLGFLPWLIAVGFGLLNYTYFNFDETILLIILPIVAAPIYFAPKFNLSWTSVFMATTFWVVLGGVGIWLFS